MKNGTGNEQASWPIQSLGWLLIGAWFSASLFSQIMYIAVYGVPYEPEFLISKLGPVYWLIGGIELLFWVILSNLFVKKIRNRKEKVVVN